MNSSNHFQLSQLAPGVFAAVCGQRGAGIGNAGLIDFGDRTLELFPVGEMVSIEV